MRALQEGARLPMVGRHSWATKCQKFSELSQGVANSDGLPEKIKGPPKIHLSY